MIGVIIMDRKKLGTLMGAMVFAFPLILIVLFELLELV